ncbi:MAG: cytochrome b/b6 domain-containing protein [Proteobacteria bacterium]|nr:cytochrome b/b6 domain-containing protein [Pseudomonadota bacterium]
MADKIRVWDLPVRVFHWSLAALVAAAYLSSDSERWRALHAGLGYVVLGLLAFRLLWGLAGTRPARLTALLHGPRAVWADLKGLLRGAPAASAGHTPAGSWMILALLGLGVAAGVSGWLAYRDGAPEGLGELHEALAEGWVVLALVHVAGAVVASLRHRENLIGAMVTGWRRGRPEEAIRSTRPLVGAVLAAAVVGGVGWALTQGAAAPPPGAAAESTMRHGLARDDD